jgi:hypothetical protein
VAWAVKGGSRLDFSVDGSGSSEAKRGCGSGDGHAGAGAGGSDRPHLVSVGGALFTTVST